MNGLVCHVPADLVDFEAGESVGERAGQRAERCDVLAYMTRKRENALRIASRGHDEHDYAHHTARALSILIDDLTGGLHEGEALVPPAGTAISEPYPFRKHRNMAEVDGAKPFAPLGALTQTGGV
ncbi:hypothetical protein [Alteriqipengyuania lutimaris]|uniref:Uncharacterized protein n=1 Tax=Alteriqipengyuania lutimaris TaxID=1538146 RepID=A0A395LJ75_9SPHN|nr:hypothetical protein [Alteriqipengyuania lutimaris]MBB3034031.1 hypothetical protein [Alteriqipengyuania lutimaris]RDS77023.1 hypothetical protein DL238_04960 [Alteriqipengyuania lutimaris]